MCDVADITDGPGEALAGAEVSEAVESVRWAVARWVRFVAKKKREREAERASLYVSTLCTECYQTMYGVLDSTWRRRQAEMRRGSVFWEHGNSAHEPYYSTKGFLCRACMNQFFCALGDYQPDTGHVHLPLMDKIDIFREMEQEIGGDCFSRPYFYYACHHQT